MKNWPRVFTILCLAALWASAGSAQNYAVGQSAAQRAPRESQAAQPPNCIHVLYCLFSQEAMASDPAGIHKYSEDLIEAVVVNPEHNGSLQRLTDQLADRLSKAERVARAGNGKLVPEAAVAKAFNDLMQQIGAPPSMQASEASIHMFREHAAALKAYPALFTADRNGTNCNPGEAVFLLYGLISSDGKLPERMLDDLVAMGQFVHKGIGSSTAYAVTTTSVGAGGLILMYSTRHQRGAIRLFNRSFREVGF